MALNTKSSHNSNANNQSGSLTYDYEGLTPPLSFEFRFPRKFNHTPELFFPDSLIQQYTLLMTEKTLTPNQVKGFLSTSNQLIHIVLGVQNSNFLQSKYYDDLRTYESNLNSPKLDNVCFVGDHIYSTYPDSIKLFVTRWWEIIQNEIYQNRLQHKQVIVPGFIGKKPDGSIGIFLPHVDKKSDLDFSESIIIDDSLWRKYLSIGILPISMGDEAFSHELGEISQLFNRTENGKLLMALIRGLNHKIVSSGTGLVNSKLISNTHYPNYSKAVEIQLFASGETLSVPKGTIDPDLIKILKSYGVSINTRDTFNKLSQLSNRDLKQLSDEILFLSALNVTRFGGASNEHQIYSWILSTETLVKFYEHEYFLLKNGKNDSDKRLHAFLEYLDKAYFHDESTNTPAYFANLAGGFFCQILTLELVGKDPKNLKTNRTKKAFLTALSYAATTILLYDELGLTSEKIISSLYQSKIKQSGPVYNFLKAATPSMSPFCTWFDVKDHRTKLKTAFESIRSRIKGAKLTADLKSKYEAHLTVLETLQEI